MFIRPKHSKNEVVVPEEERKQNTEDTHSELTF
jgi:hypothetical protein